MVIRRNSFFFLFPFSYYHGPTFFSGRLAKNLSWREDKGSRTKRGAFFPWKFSFNYRGVVCLAICVHFLFLFSPPPSSSSWIKVDLSSISSSSDIELFEWINLLPLMKLAREPPAYTCAKLRSANRFRANVNIHDAAKEFQLEVGSVNFNHNYSRPLFIGCSV